MENTENEQTEAAEKPTRVELPHTVTLVDPFKLGSQTVESVTFKNRLCADMVKHLPVGAVGSFTLGHLYPIVSKMTGETMEVVGRLGWDDLQECVGIASAFLGNGQKTGPQE